MEKPDCQDCMYDAPFCFCCKQECDEHEFCVGCSAESRKNPIPCDCPCQ